jgi:uncharacterized spore protein YtfJ
MNTTEMLEKIGESLKSTATVTSVFGEPVHTEGKTVIPVARVAYGFGAGFGSGLHKHDSNNGQQAEGEGGGGGGGVTAFPAGVLEITPTHTRFIRFMDTSLLAGVFAAGAVLGILISGSISGSRAWQKADA